MLNEAIETGGVAVVTGAASGVGFAAAQEFARRGLGVVLADRSEDALGDATKAIQELANDGAPVAGVALDVSDAVAVARLADQAFALGPVAALMNNAGVSMPTKSWTEPDNWRRIIDVNLFGVVNGLQAFMPRMVAAARPAVVINTGSKQGITTPPGNPGYNISKAGVKILTEMLTHELREADAPISAHLFVPGFTYTGMVAAHRPEKPPAAWTSEQAVEHLFARMAEGDFYVLCPDNEVTPERDRRRIAWAAGDIIENRPPLSRWRPDFAEAFVAFEKS